MKQTTFNLYKKEKIIISNKILKKEKLPCIYRATSKTTGKSYIGQTTVGFVHRKSEHLCDSRKQSYSVLNKFHKAIVDLGEGDFVWEILYYIDDPLKSNQEIIDILNTKEIAFILEYDSFNNGYNSDKGEGNRIRTPMTDKQMQERLEYLQKERQSLIENTKKPGKSYLEKRKIRNSNPVKKQRLKELRDKRHNTPEYRAKRKAYSQSIEAKIIRKKRLNDPIHKQKQSLKRKARRLKKKLEQKRLIIK